MNDLEKIIHILSLSSLHKNHKIGDLRRLILPPIRLKQYLLLVDPDKVFYASWAFMSQEASDAYEHQTRSLKAEDWNSGHIPWIIDIISPLGQTAQGIKELKKIPRLLGVKGKIRYYRHKKGEKKIHHVTWL